MSDTSSAGDTEELVDAELSFGRWLKVCRVARRVTQAELAKRTGYATVTIRKLESDDLRPSRQIAAKIGAQLELDPEACSDLIRYAQGEARFDELRLPIGTQAVPQGAPLSPAPRPTRRHNLPAAPTSLVGRERELDDLRNLLLRPDVRLVTLTGPGGIGKTRLALQAASDLPPFDDGICFVDLAPIHELRLVAATVAKALGVREAPGQPLPDRLQDYLRDKQLLLVLDNFEHVISAAPLVADLLAACPRLTALVTSREPLRLRGEKVFPVPPLQAPHPDRLPDAKRLAQYPAAVLFTQRAQDVKPDWRLTDANAPAIAAICARLDGLPLAIELAAARSQLLAPEAILARLVGTDEHAGSSLRLLTGGARDLPARQQTLRNTIAWSYDLLDDTEQQLFRRLSVFAGGFTLEAAEAVFYTAGDPSPSAERDVLDAVASLLDKGLVQQAERTDIEPRLTMLETIREYGRERLADSGEIAGIQEQQALFFLRLVEQAEPHLYGFHQLAWLTRLVREYDNLRAALRWGIQHPESDVGLRLAGSLLRLWQLNGDWTEAGRWLRDIVAGNRAPHNSPGRAKALYAAAICDWVGGDLSTANERVAESVAIFRSAGDKPGLAFARGVQALVLGALGDGAAWGVVMEAVELARAVDETWILVAALHQQGWVANHLGDAPAAQAAFEESATLSRTIGDRWRLLINLRFLSYIARAQGNFSRAGTLIEEALTLAYELGNRLEVAWALQVKGEIAQAAGDYGSAAAHYDACLALFRDLGSPLDAAAVLVSQARLAHLQADLNRAVALLREGLLILKHTTDSVEIAICLSCIADVARGQGMFARSARLLGAVHALHQDVNTPPFADANRGAYDQAMAATRAELDAESFAASWAKGQAMTLEQAVAYALEEGGAATGATTSAAISTSDGS